MKKIHNENKTQSENKLIKKNFFISDNLKNYIIIIFIGLILSIPLFKGFIIAHDSNAHIARVLSTIIALRKNQILPLIASNYVNGFGYTWNLFYPPLTNYLTILCRVVCSTFVQASNLLVSLSIIISGIFMYHFSKKVTKSKKIGILSAIIYMTVPYRISDIYIRYALGEVVSFVFIPLIFLGLYNIFEDNGKRNYILTIGAIGVLLTHNITSLLIIITCAIFVIVNFKKLKNIQVIKNLLINAIFIILIVIFFFGPLLEAKSYTDYAIFTEVVDMETLNSTALSFWEVIVGKLYFSEDVKTGERVSAAIGLVVFLITLSSIFVYKKIDKSKRKLYITSIIISLMCIILSMDFIPWNYMPSVFKYIQFPYRLLIISVFLLSIISAVNLEKIFKNLSYKKIGIISLICIAYITPLLVCTQIDNEYNELAFYEIEENDMPYPHSNSIYCGGYEYLPSKAYNNLKYIFERSREPEFVIGPGVITELKVDEKNNYSFYVENLGTNILKIEMPLIYYPGYTIMFNDKEIEPEESDIGLLLFTLPGEENGTVTVTYTGTEVQHNCLIVSVVGIILFIIYIMILEIRYYRKKRILNQERGFRNEQEEKE